MQFFRLLPKISPNLGYIFTPRPSYFKVLDPPLSLFLKPAAHAATSGDFCRGRQKSPLVPQPRRHAWQRQEIFVAEYLMFNPYN
jgi:hypothetical protein